MSANAYILFVKYPEAGKVKTRLAKSISAENAAMLYRALVEKLVSGLDSSLNTMIFVSPPEKTDDVRSWLGEQFSYLPQQGDDLGEKMYNALNTAFGKGYRKAVLTGSDIPELNSRIIKKAFDLLDEKDAVIGEAADGGYYLISFNSGTLSDEFFKDINWSTNIVFSQTMHIFKETNRSVAFTDVLRDLDTEEDLRELENVLQNIKYK